MWNGRSIHLNGHLHSFTCALQCAAARRQTCVRRTEIMQSNRYVGKHNKRWRRWRRLRRRRQRLGHKTKKKHVIAHVLYRSAKRASTQQLIHYLSDLRATNSTRQLRSTLREFIQFFSRVRALPLLYFFFILLSLFGLLIKSISYLSLICGDDDDIGACTFTYNLFTFKVQKESEREKRNIVGSNANELIKLHSAWSFRSFALISK